MANKVKLKQFFIGALHKKIAHHGLMDNEGKMKQFFIGSPSKKVDRIGRWLTR